jgi:hypothetical protein
MIYWEFIRGFVHTVDLFVQRRLLLEFTGPLTLFEMQIEANLQDLVRFVIAGPFAKTLHDTFGGFMNVSVLMKKCIVSARTHT